ncbi:sterol desaturase family protein [Ramlibacter tataouinensis]|uniref:Candidate membrane protein n=1 Tax=Ramlibacter tataouinensis (strain ATCC BAA-407 / DSM 14655 / LMG 21543 / TTB310) TaxID=365046 RepID=F5Y466_RAMTT|nr:sterol desaturase family protein [Ramlibacter tataouinensis]AEG92531.1 candidate membrane protein [Ramlibacter tataouinensis TTB310]
MGWIEDRFSAAQQWLFEAAVQPLLFALGLGQLLEDGYAATGWLLVGLLQIAVMLAVFAPLQRWRPVEAVTDRAAIRTDIVYTLVHRLGLFRLALFFSVEPLFDALFGATRAAGWGTWHLDQLWPGVTDLAWVSFAIYLVVFDFADYWIHRGQHGLRWWWSLHALHHSQRQMTLWSDNRNHLLDDLLRDSLLVLLGQMIGVAPGQFVAIVAITQLSESLHHANLRLWFGRVGERLWVSPRFHRRHHSIGIGHEKHGRGTLGGCNFSVLLPWWDLLFRTANFELRYDPTGVRDQVERGRDYGRGFWSQQWLGLKRLVGRA